MENFDGARDYLARHQVHEMWEACVAELVQHQPRGKQKITDAIVDVVLAAERRKSDPLKRVVAVLGLPEVQFGPLVDETVSADSSCSIVKVGPTDSVRAVAIQVAGAQSDTVVLVGFPRNMTDAVTFESSACQFAHCVTFVTNECLADPATEKQAATLENFLTQVNPITAYYDAVGKGTVINVDDAKRSPVAELRAVLESARK